MKAEFRSMPCSKGDCDFQIILTPENLEERIKLERFHDFEDKNGLRLQVTDWWSVLGVSGYGELGFGYFRNKIRKVKKQINPMLSRTPPPLVKGVVWFNPTTKVLKKYDGKKWVKKFDFKGGKS